MPESTTASYGMLLEIKQKIQGVCGINKKYLVAVRPTGKNASLAHGGFSFK
jgi:hypothetical protein